MNFKSVIVLMLLACSSTVNASEIVMQCEDTIYKYETSLLGFGDSEIFIRDDGSWEVWCADKHVITCEVPGDQPPCFKSRDRQISSQSGTCHTIARYTNQKGEKWDIELNTVLDFEFFKKNELTEASRTVAGRTETGGGPKNISCELLR